MDKQFTFGLMQQEKAFGTVVHWSNRGWGVCECSNFGTDSIAQFWLREQEVMFPCGNYFVPTDAVAKPINPGDIIECSLIEIEGGLLGLGARKINDIDLAWEGTFAPLPELPRLIGVVKHWNYEESYGFIKSDSVIPDLFFHRREVMVPYETLQSPPRAITMSLTEGNLVTFDSVSTPRGMRALAISRWKGDL